MTKEAILENYTPIPYAGCWIWEGNIRAPGGYGVVYYEGETQYVHRTIYKLLKGEIPEGMCICHTCDTPSCMNPDHLFLGTQKDNMKDALAKGRLARGARMGNAKLSTEDVLEIRALFNKNIPKKQIARKYKVFPSTIRKIINKTNWGWLDGEGT